MRLTASNGDFVELEIAEYEFGSTERTGRGDWDANWILISGRVNHSGEAWKFYDPCLTTWEANDLLRFLRKPHKKVSDPLDFTEPNLSVQVTATCKQIVVLTFTFRAESAPPSTPEDERWNTGRQVELPVARDALLATANDWAAELKNFPAR